MKVQCAQSLRVGAPHPTPRILHAATPPACCTRRRHKRPARTAVRDLRPAMYAKKPAGIQSAPPLASTREGLHTPAFPAPLADCPTPKPPVCVVAHSQLFRRQLGIITWWGSALKEVCGSGLWLATPVLSTPKGLQRLLFVRRCVLGRPSEPLVCVVTAAVWMHTGAVMTAARTCRSSRL